MPPYPFGERAASFCARTTNDARAAASSIARNALNRSRPSWVIASDRADIPRTAGAPCVPCAPPGFPAPPPGGGNTTTLLLAVGSPGSVLRCDMTLSHVGGMVALLADQGRDAIPPQHHKPHATFPFT